MSNTVFSEDLVATIYPEDSKEVSDFLTRLISSPAPAVNWLLKKSQENTKFASALLTIIKSEYAGHEVINSFASEKSYPIEKSKYTCTIIEPMAFLNSAKFLPNEMIEWPFEFKNTSEDPFLPGFYITDECGTQVLKTNKKINPNDSLYIKIVIRAPSTLGKHIRKFMLYDNEGKAVGDPIEVTLGVVDKATKDNTSVYSQYSKAISKRMPKGTFSGIFSTSKLPPSAANMAPLTPQKDQQSVQKGNVPPQPLPNHIISQYNQNGQLNNNNGFNNNLTAGYQQQQQQQQQPPPPPYQPINTQDLQYGDGRAMNYVGYPQSQPYGVNCVQQPQQFLPSTTV